MKTLISMTAFVKEQYENNYHANTPTRILNYANFLSLTPEIWMFVPCKLVDGGWVVLKEPLKRDYDNVNINNSYFKEYQQAKERCFFEGFEVKERNCNEAKFKYIENGLIAVFYYNKTTNSFEENTDFKTLEDLTPYNLTLTANAIKEIGL